jgi:hypothetical protein
MDTAAIQRSGPGKGRRLVWAGSAHADKGRGAQRIRQAPSGAHHRGPMTFDGALTEPIERCGHEKRASQSADLVKNRHGQAASAFDVLRDRKVNPGAASLLNTFQKLLTIKNGSRRHLLEIGHTQESLPPFRRLKRDEHDAEGAMERHLTNKWFDDPGRSRPVAPVDDDSLVSLQDREAAIFSRNCRQFFDEGMGKLQQLSKWFERCRQRQQARAQLIFAILKALQNAVVSQRIHNSSYSWKRKLNPRRNTRQRRGAALRNYPNNPNCLVNNLNRHQLQSPPSHARVAQRRCMLQYILAAVHERFCCKIRFAAGA